VRCWGNGDDYQLGDGGDADSATPVDVLGGLSGVVQVVGGEAHTCAVVDADVYCWGSNAYGQLSFDPAVIEHVTSPQAAAFGMSLGLAAGRHTTCSLQNTGLVECAGRGDHGELGPDVTGVEFVPRPIANVLGAIRISGGDHQFCAWSSMPPACWGADGHSQLNLGTMPEFGPRPALCPP
jgi:alpha-tubulin suppressor-like RCC1 family protein